MKISINNITANYNDLQFPTREATRSLLSSSESSNFDHLYIQSNPRLIQESSFAESLAKHLSQEVASPEKDCEAIKAQVQNHTYCIDASAIAARILLLGEEL